MSKRVMMSDRAGRSAFFIPWANGVDTTTRATAAVDEARHILAETEPDCGAELVDLGCRQPVHEARIAALKDSLSEFVLSADAASYLARKAVASKVRASILRVASTFAAIGGADDPGAHLATVAR